MEVGEVQRWQSLGLGQRLSFAYFRSHTLTGWIVRGRCVPRGDGAGEPEGAVAAGVLAAGAATTEVVRREDVEAAFDGKVATREERFGGHGGVPTHNEGNCILFGRLDQRPRGALYQGCCLFP